MKLNKPRTITYTNQTTQKPENHVVVVEIEDVKKPIKAVWLSADMPTISAVSIDKKGNMCYGRIQNTTTILESVYLQNADKYAKAYTVEDAPIEDKRVKDLLIEIDQL